MGEIEDLAQPVSAKRDRARRPIRRRLLRDDVRQEILDLVLRGELKPGERLVESELAEFLGVSRTPLREALFRLDREGFLTSHPSKGFTVLPLTVEEVENVYPVCCCLEQFAFELTGIEQAYAVLPQLQEINSRLKEFRHTPDVALELDTEWHRTLLSGCHNDHLLKLIEAQKTIVRRYEHAYMRDPEAVNVSIEQHAAIMAGIADKDFERALAGLRANWYDPMRLLILRMQSG